MSAFCFPSPGLQVTLASARKLVVTANKLKDETEAELYSQDLYSKTCSKICIIKIYR